MSGSWLYTLDAEKNPVPVDLSPYNDPLSWEVWQQRYEHWLTWILDPDNKRVQVTQVEQKTVSTVFLGRNMNYGGINDRVLLFETLVFSQTGAVVDGFEVRYETWDEAVQGHQAIVACLSSGLAQNLHKF